jgi:hypothetical protein
MNYSDKSDTGDTVFGKVQEEANEEDNENGSPYK